MLTAHGDVATTRAALKAGAFDFIEKPFDDEVLLRTIGAATQTSVRMRASDERDARFARDLGRLTPASTKCSDARARRPAQPGNRRAAGDQPAYCRSLQGAHHGQAHVDRFPDLIRLALEMGLGNE